MTLPGQEDPGEHGQDDAPDAPETSGAEAYVVDPYADPYAGFDGSTTGGGAGGDGGLSTRGVLIAAAVVGVVLVGAVVLAIGLSAGGPETPEARATSSPAPPASAAVPPASPPPSAPPSASPSSAPSASASPSSAAPVQRWHGTLTVNGPRARRDLDAVPPRTDEDRADVRGDWLKTTLKAVGDARVAVFEDGGRPGAVACRDAALAAGSAETEAIDDGDVVCVATGDGRVARLIVTHATQTSTAPELSFDATVWDVPGAGQ